MTLPLQYSKQESTLKPSGITEEYLRLQVKLRPELGKVIISDKDYDLIIESLAEGRLIGLQTESGINLGQFQTALAGAYVATDFKSPMASDVRISFKATQHILKHVREIVTFERIPMVINNPQISGFIFTGVVNNIQTQTINQIPLNTSGVLKIMGINFTKAKMNVDVVQSISSSGKSVSKTLNPAINSGTKYIEILISNELLQSKDFDSGVTPSPSYTRIMVTHADNPARSSIFNFEFLPSPVPKP